MVEVIGKIETNFTLHEIHEVAKRLIEAATGLKVWIFIGDMGVGKTTLIKAIAKELGVKEVVQSPTFSIVNEYFYGESKIYHFDFYRIKNEEEAFDIGVDEYFGSGEFCFIEWPDKIPLLLPDQYFEIRITQWNNIRTLAYQKHE